MDQEKPKAFKEWSLICDALESGRQTLILRKGGIAEGREGFGFKEREFFLFPTHYHGQLESLRHEARPNGALHAGSAPSESQIAIRLHAAVVHSAILTNWEEVQALESHHVWQPSVIEERFRYGGADALHLAVIRVSRLEPVWELENSPGYGGCRSWVELPMRPAGMGMTRVLSDAEFGVRTALIEKTLGL